MYVYVDILWLIGKEGNHVTSGQKSSGEHGFAYMLINAHHSWPYHIVASS